MNRGAQIFLRAFVFVLVAPLALIVGTLVFSFVAAPAPPEGRGASGDAVLRVISPEGEPYGIIWNYETEETGESPEGSFYRDYGVPPAAGSRREGFNVALYRLEDEAGERWDGPFKAILFVEGEYATCSTTEVPVLRLYWRPEEEPGNLLTRAYCGGYRYTRDASA